MVGEVRPDTWEGEARADAVAAQVPGRSDAGAHQQRRVAVDAGTQNDVAGRDGGAVEQTNARGAVAVELDRRDLRVAAHGDPVTGPIRVERRGAAAPVGA